MNKLKPCPFCGGEYPDSLLIEGEFVQCDACGCCGVYLVEWNTRYQDPTRIEVDRERLTAIAAELADNPDPEIVAIGIELGVWLQGGE